MKRRIEPQAAHKVAAWLVHLLTASGSVCGFLALHAIHQDQFAVAFAFMLVAAVVDGVDGGLARWFQVKKMLPQFDGALLDNIVDFLNYVVVPIWLMVRADLFPSELAMGVAACVLIASCYQFCQGDAKTADHFFKGFPCYWNVCAFYLYLLSFDPWLNLGIAVACCVLVFVPVKYVYPTRTLWMRQLTLGLALPWTVALVVILARLDHPPSWLVWGSLCFLIYYVTVSLLASFRSGVSVAKSEDP